MLGAAVGFFSAVLSALIATINALAQSNWVELALMLTILGAGALLTFLEMSSSAGAIVALKIAIILVNIFALSYLMYNDIMDSDGIVG